MRTRILAGAGLVVTVAVVLTAQSFIPILLPVVVALVGAIAVKEVLHSTGLCTVKPMVALAVLPVLVAPFICQGYLSIPLSVLYVVYAMLSFLGILCCHTKLTFQGMLAVVFFPILLAYAFGSVVALTQAEGTKMLFLFLVFCWSSVADVGAYFVGVFFGKHKMAKIISPKKSWEGLVGGLMFGTIAAFLLCLLYRSVFGFAVHTWLVVCLSPLMIAIGVMGDLTASLIKRRCEIKDFGNLIPGHGGILDRFDSILMISALFWQICSLISFS